MALLLLSTFAISTIVYFCVAKHELCTTASVVSHFGQESLLLFSCTNTKLDQNVLTFCQLKSQLQNPIWYLSVWVLWKCFRKAVWKKEKKGLNKLPLSCKPCSSALPPMAASSTKNLHIVTVTWSTTLSQGVNFSQEHYGRQSRELRPAHSSAAFCLITW